MRFRNFNDHILRKKEERRTQQTALADLEDELKKRRVVHRDAVKEQGQLIAEAEVCLQQHSRSLVLICGSGS